MKEEILFRDIKEHLLSLTSKQLDRRAILIDEMFKLESEQKDCFSCSGMCCTYEFNSMLITPIECFELLNYLELEGRIDEDLFTKLNDYINDFRLDREIYLGNNREFRRYYTCPFFRDQNKGCSISRSAKPYGCLGFNPKERIVNSKGKCGSNQALLEKRHHDFCASEKEANDYLSKILGLYWEKKPIPVALREFLIKLKF